MPVAVRPQPGEVGDPQQLPELLLLQGIQRDSS